MIGRIVDRLEEAAIAFLLAFMTALTFLQVVLRYGFNSGFVWALEATTYAFIWMVLIGISYGVRHNAHIGVDMAVNLLPARTRRIVGFAGVAICLAYTALMLWGSWELVSRLMALGANARDIPLPRWLLTSILPVGFLLLGWRLVEVALQILRGERDRLGLGHEDSAPEDLAADLHVPAGAIPTPTRT